MKNYSVQVFCLLLVLLVGTVSVGAADRLLWSNSELDRSSGEARYHVAVPAAGILTVDAVSLGFAPRLSVLLPDGEYISGESDARSASLSFFVPAGGNYTITLSTGEHGRPGDQSEQAVQYLLSAELVRPTANLNESQIQRGVLSAQARLHSSGSYINWYNLRVPESGRALVRLESEEFDTVLVVYYPNGRTDYNDDYGDSTNSGLVVRASPGVSVLVGATSFSSGSTGSYRVSVEALEPLPGLTVYRPHMLLESATLYVFELEDGEHSFQIRLDAGNAVEILMESDDLDSYLELHGPYGGYWSDDDGGGQLNALLSLNPPVSGVYNLTARSFGFGGSRGVYTLRVSAAPQLREVLSSSGRFTGAPVAFGVPLTAGNTFTIEVSSPDFDTVMTLYGPDGSYITEDDDGGDGTDSRLRFTPSLTGTYGVEVSGFSSDRHGTFLIRVSEHQE